MSIVSCYIIVNADTTVDEDFDRHQRIQITTADYSSVHLLLPADHTAAATFLNNLINTCTRLIDHIRQPHEPDTVKAEPAGATSSAHTDPPHTLQPGPHERLKRGQISCSNSGVVHRDVKPSNILLDEEGLPRLADFGLSFAVDAAGTTNAGSIVGTAAYLAPEQVLGDRADSAADVFALGLVLIECLTGIREYPGSPAESAVARLHRLPTVPQGLPRGVSETLEQMTAWDPAERPDAEGCAAVFGRPGPIDPVPELSDPVAMPFGADDETVWIQPAVTHPASGKARSGRKLSGALATAAVFMAAGVAVIAFHPGVGSPTAHVPTVAAQPHPATAPGSTSTATPPPLQASPPSTPATGNAPPSTLSTTPVAVVAAAVQIDSEPPTEKNKNHGQGKVQGHGHGQGHGQGHPHGHGQDG